MNEQERLQAILKDLNSNARDFANEVGISAATMSNILNGRNKPSLEVLQKVIARYRNLSSDWLFLGVGSMYLGKADSRVDESKSNEIQFEPDPDMQQQIPVQSCRKQTSTQSVKASMNMDSPSATMSKQITKILVFYSDGTFEELLK